MRAFPIFVAVVAVVVAVFAWRAWRRQALRGVIGLLLTVLAGFFYVRYGEPNWITITHPRFVHDGLAQALAGRRIVHITDLHVDRFGPRERLTVWQVNRQHPDWIVITGDVANRLEDGWPAALELVRQLRATQGVWVVPGNTDHAAVPQDVFDRDLTALGAHVLRNAAAPLGDTGAWLVGVDDAITSRARLTDALREVPTTSTPGLDSRPPIILLSHGPDIMGEAGRAGIPVVLAGHTHGGQFGIHPLRVLSRYANRGPYMSGLYTEGHTQLYVNRGIGWKTRPYRFMAWPEVAVIEFRATKGRVSTPAAAAPAGPAEPTTSPARVNADLWLSDFETPGEFAVRWRVAEAYAAASPEHATHGTTSAKVTFKAGQEPKFVMEGYIRGDRRRRDWSPYRALHLDLFNPQPDQERLILQIKDANNRLYKEEVGILGNSPLHIMIRVADLAPYMDVTRIAQVNLFRWRPGHEASIHVDAVRLEAFAPGQAPEPIGRRPAASGTPVADHTSGMVPGSVAADGSGAAEPTGRSPVPAVVPQAAWQVARAGSLIKVLRAPAMFEGESSAGPIALSLARGEAEHAQVVLVGGRESVRVHVSVGPLKPASGGAALPAEAVRVRAVGYVETVRPYYPVTHVGQWPDPLLNTAQVDVPPNQLQPIWISVEAPADAAPGRYESAIGLRDEHGRVETLPLTVTIRSFTLPSAPTLQTAVGFYRFRLEQAYRSPEGSAPDRASMDELERRGFLTLLRHRLWPIWNADPSSTQFAWDAKTYLDHNLGMFNIGRHGGNTDAAWPRDAVDLEEAMVWYRQAMLELGFYRLLDQAYVYAFDEPALDNPQVPMVLAALHDVDPKLTTLVTLNRAPDPARHAAWLKDADILCIRITAFDPEQATAWRAMGKRIWLYVSSPAHPFPNVVVDEPALHHRILPWMLWKYGASGWLYWCANFWADNPWERANTFAEDQNGNGVLLYPGAEGPLASLRLEVLRDGLEDYEYLSLLASAVQRAKARGADAALIAQAETLLTVDETVVESLRNYASDPAVLLSRRDAIAAMIEQLGGS